MIFALAATQVLGLMGQVVEGQRWGLGATGSDAQFKGGWGPGSRPGMAGGFLDRQLGIVTIDGKPLAVSIATVPADGLHESGTRNLTEPGLGADRKRARSQQAMGGVCS